MRARHYVIEVLENREKTHWIITLTDWWVSRPITNKAEWISHSFKGSSDGNKVVIDAPKDMSSEFLILLLKSAFVMDSTLVVIKKDDWNNTKLKFHVNRLNDVALPSQGLKRGDELPDRR